MNIVPYDGGQREETELRENQPGFLMNFAQNILLAIFCLIFVPRTIRGMF